MSFFCLICSFKLQRLEEPVSVAYMVSQLDYTVSVRRLDLLCAILYFELGRHAGASSRLASTCCLDTVHLLDPSGSPLLGVQLQPGDGLFAILPRGCVVGGAGRGIFGGRDLAQVPVGRVEVEEGSRGGEEVVVPADHVVAGSETLVGRGGNQVVGVGARLGRGEVEGEGDAREHVEQVWVSGRDT